VFESLKKEVSKDEKCTAHDQPMIYYCTTCSVSICSDCAMFGTDHKDHKFEHLEKVYNKHKNTIKQESEYIKLKLQDYIKSMDGIRRTIEIIQKSKEEKEDELIRVMTLLKDRLELQLKEKLMILLSEKNVIGDEINYLENLQKGVDKEINECSKTSLIGKSKELIQAIDEVKTRPSISFNGVDVSPEFPSELVPEYVGGIFELPKFSQARQASPNQFLSAPLLMNGLTWRLKVYPNGNGPFKGSFLAVFFCMEDVF